MDAVSNLAFVRVCQKRYRDADNLFNAAVKSKIKIGLGYDCSINLYESVTQISLLTDRNVDAKKSQLRCIHQCPSDLKLWYNYACIIMSKIEKIFRKTSTSKSEVAECMQDIHLSSNIFTLLLQSSERFVGHDVLKVNAVAVREYKSRIKDILARGDKTHLP